MKNSKILLSALFVFCVLTSFGQNKTLTTPSNNSGIAKINSSNISELSNPRSHTLFVSANIQNQSNSIVKYFNVNALRSGYVKIQNLNSNNATVIFVEEGYNEIQFLCPRGQYTLTWSEIDINDPKMTN